MRDPIDELENFSTPGLPMNPLPASEVRRRGTRMRRRKNALATIGAAAAVAVIATPIALAANGGNSGGSAPPPGPATQPPGGWVQTVPTDFPLTAGLPGGTMEPGEDAHSGLTVCGPDAGEVVSNGPGASDMAHAAVEEANSSGTEARTLTLYADGRSADAATRALQQLVASCGTDRNGGADPLVNEIATGDLGGDASYVLTQQARGSDNSLYDLTTMMVVRSGNAIYVTSSHTSAGGQQVLDIEVQRLAERSEAVIGAMCVFSVEGCGPARPDVSDAVDEPTGLSGAIPDTFPLERGLPTDAQGGVGIEGPAHDLDLAVYNLENQLRVCGVAPTRLPEATDTLYAGFRSAALGVLRQLMTFESEADAETYAENLMAPFAACPEDADSRGVAKIYEVIGESAGDQATSAVMRVEVEGEPGPGFQIVQVVRVGQAVLQTVVASEGEPSPSLNELRTRYLEDSQSVIDEMS